jgi:SAM-dependent methyltransferase
MKIPSILDLVHLSRRPLFPPGGIELCRQIALLTDMKEGDEVLVVPSGLAVTLEHFVREYEVQGSGVEDDLILLNDAEERLRGIGMLDRVHVQPGEMDGLPFRDGIFDVVIAELGITARVSPESAVKELVRVAKAGASIVLVQPVWKAPVDPVRREVLSQYLGCRPLMLVEWKRFLMDAGIEGLHTEDWSDEETAFRPQITKPFPDFTELFSVSDKIGILRRARRRWGWVGVWAAWAREREVHKLLTQERILGLNLVMGVKHVAGTATEGAALEAPGGEDAFEVAEGADVSVDGDQEKEHREEKQLTGLPLFGDKGEVSR